MRADALVVPETGLNRHGGRLNKIVLAQPSGCYVSPVLVRLPEIILRF
jgi:hypothetical protein